MKKSIFALLIVLVVVVVGVVVMGLKDRDQESPETPSTDNPVPTDRIEKVTLLSVGDIMFHDSQIEKVDTQPTGYFFEDSMALIKPYAQAADVAIANYESTSTPTSNYRGYPTFNSPVETLDAIKVTGFDILSTINNHTLDSGKQGLIDTYDAIVEREMIPLGTKTSPDQESLKTIEKNGIKLGFLAYTYGYNGLDGALSAEEHDYMVSFMDSDKIEREIKSSLEAGNDFTIVMMHWGNEYQTSPTSEQRQLAAKMVEWGADIILGSHPHVVQEEEILGDSFIIYSMGNFISNQRLETLDDIETERGLMLEFVLEKNFTADTKKIEAIEYMPLWVNKYTRDNANYHEVIPTKDFLEGRISPFVPEGALERIQAAFDETMRRVKKNN